MRLFSVVALVFAMVAELLASLSATPPVAAATRWQIHHGCDTPSTLPTPSSDSAQKALYAAERRAILEAVESAQNNFASIKDSYKCTESSFSGTTPQFEEICQPCGLYMLQTFPIFNPADPSQALSYTTLTFELFAPELSLSAAIPWMKKTLVPSLPSGFEAVSWYEPNGPKVAGGSGIIDRNQGTAKITYFGPGPVGLRLEYSSGRDLEVMVAGGPALAYQHRWSAAQSSQATPGAPTAHASSVAAPSTSVALTPGQRELREASATTLDEINANRAEYDGQQVDVVGVVSSLKEDVEQLPDGQTSVLTDFSLCERSCVNVETHTSNHLGLHNGDKVEVKGQYAQFDNDLFPDHFTRFP